MMAFTSCIAKPYDIRMATAIDHTNFALDASVYALQSGFVQSATEILGRLESKGVTRQQIADALGITQPNASKLYQPAAKTGKPRQLSYDEAVILIQRFKLEQSVTSISEELLTPIVDEIAMRLARRPVPESSIRPLVGALSRYLQLVGERPAIHANQDALAAVARAVAPPVPEATNEA